MVTGASRPCGLRTGGHRHRVSWNGSRRREFRADRCNSELLWATVARAILQDAEPLVDREPPRWTKEEAWAYLLTVHPRWRRGISEPGS